VTAFGDITEPSVWPRGVMDPLCPEEHVVTETMDRRILWHLETKLAVSATTDYLRDVQWNLRRYLVQACQHHWHEWEAEGDFPAGRQCLWCDDTHIEPRS
jgi:hypothetical protein